MGGAPSAQLGNRKVQAGGAGSRELRRLIELNAWTHWIEDREAADPRVRLIRGTLVPRWTTAGSEIECEHRRVQRLNV